MSILITGVGALCTHHMEDGEHVMLSPLTRLSILPSCSDADTDDDGELDQVPVDRTEHVQAQVLERFGVRSKDALDEEHNRIVRRNRCEEEG